MNQQTISIILICAGALWGVFELFKRMPKGEPAPTPEPVTDNAELHEGSLENEIAETPGGYFFLNLLNQIELAEDDRTKRHLIEAGKSYLDGFISEPKNDGNSPT